MIYRNIQGKKKMKQNNQSQKESMAKLQAGQIVQRIAHSFAIQIQLSDTTQGLLL